MLSSARSASSTLLPGTGRRRRVFLLTVSRLVWAARSFLARVRATGWRSTLKYLRERGTPSDDAVRYHRWVELNAPTEGELARMRADAQQLAYQPRISVVTPVYNTPAKWLLACIESVRRQAYPKWELCLCDDASSSEETTEVLRQAEADPRIRVRALPSNANISAASNAALATASGDFVALLDHDDELPPEALYQVVRYLNDHPDVDVIYSDEDKLDLSGARCDPYFKPDWSPELFLSTMYTCHLMVVRRTLLEQIGGFRVGYEGAQDYDLLLRLMERTDRIHHIPKILYHWRKIPGSAAAENAAKPWALDSGRRALDDYVRRTHLDADVLPGWAPGVFRMRHAIKGQPLVSVIIPTKGCGGGEATERRLLTCVRSLVERTSYRHYQLVLVADGGELPASVNDVLKDARHQSVGWPDSEPFNFSRKVNAGVQHAEGAHLLLLNDDVEVREGDWLTALLEYSQQERIGAVGAKLFYPDGRLQHIGIVIGVCGVAGHAFHQHPGSSPGVAGR